MSRLPTPGSDNGTWGTVLNDFLGVEHAADGTLKIRTDGTLSNFYVKPGSGIPANDLASSVQNTLNSVSGKISSSTVTTKGDVLVASGNAAVARLGVGSDGQRLVADSSQPLGVAWASDSFIFASDYGVMFDASTDDAPALQTAIDAAISTKKMLVLDPGTAMIGTSLSIHAPLSIIGSGRESTTLKATNGLNDYVIKFTGGTAGVGIVGAHFADFAIDGNSANQTAGGAILANGAVQCSFERLHLFSVYNWGLVLGPITGGAFGHHNRIVSCLFDNSGGSTGSGGGAWITSSDENWFVASDFEFLGGSTAPSGSGNPVMLYDQAGLQTVMGCCFVSGSNNCIGVRVQNTKGTKIINSTFDGIGGDSVFIAANKCIISNNLFTGIGDAGTTAASGIHLEFNTHYNTVTGNALETSPTAGKTHSLIREEGIGGAGDNVIMGNTLSQNAAPTITLLESAGTNTIVRNNIGWVTEAKGVATIANGTTSITVNHGLSVTPAISAISITPTNSLGTAGKFWVSNPTGTQFTINVDTDPGATTAAFAWIATA